MCIVSNDHNKSSRRKIPSPLTYFTANMVENNSLKNDNKGQKYRDLVGLKEPILFGNYSMTQVIWTNKLSTQNNTK